MNREITIKEAFDRIKKAVQEDEDYAWGWQSNVAVPFIDKGLSHKEANDGAAIFMDIAFGINIKENRFYKSTFEGGN